MDKIESLIHQFMSEETGKLDTLDRSKKPSILVSLEDSLDDARVLDFFLKLGADENEYDLARIEIFKILQTHEFSDASVRERIGNLIQSVLLKSIDNDVRNYAAMAAVSYMDRDAVFEALDTILSNAHEHADVRWNAFAAMNAMGATEKSVRRFQDLQLTEEFRNAATRVLLEWNFKG